ncbi:hydrogenase maturation protease [Magnetovibrio sp. PR-2]|uniref:hydrogenase maturation protease n=1 Tax=Magnetovibrio sp. PR-2 TaxID=3120356 RepID=UPI002FCE441C
MALVIGVGNAMRGDDGLGAAVVDALSDHPGIETFAFDGDGIELMVLWQGRHHVVVVDATQSDKPAGTLQRFEAHEAELPQNLFRHSTHQFGVVEAVEMARVLGDFPDRLTVIGVEGADFTLGAGLSDAVKGALDDAVAEVLKACQP